MTIWISTLFSEIQGQGNHKMELKTLTTDEILRIHEILVEDFIKSNDPISPSGLRSEELLESAVSRQWTSLGDVMKYPTPVENASTLLYGLCGDHPFFNGNKRTALVSMLAHLDKNKLSLYGTNQDDLYRFMISVASHSLGMKIDRRRQKPMRKRSSDEEVQAICSWLKKRVKKVVRGERSISYREIKSILQRFDYDLHNPKNNTIDIVRNEERKKGFIRKKKIEYKKRIGNVPYPGEHKTISIKYIKYIRNICLLREEDGIDSNAFYDDTVILHSFVNKYRKILRNLAKT